MNHSLQKKYPLITDQFDPILRTRCSEVEVLTPELKELWEALLILMEEYNGVWLAAPQVGHAVRMMAVSELDTRWDERHVTDTTLMINPQVLSKSDTTVVDEEWCLSIPGVTGDVARPSWITVQYETLKWKKVVKKVQGYSARIILHEIDHLDGVLFIDKTV